MGNPPKPSPIQTMRPPRNQAEWDKLCSLFDPKAPMTAAPSPSIKPTQIPKPSEKPTPPMGFRPSDTTPKPLPPPGELTQCKEVFCKEMTDKEYCSFDCEDWHHALGFPDAKT